MRVNNVVGLFMHGPCTYVLGGWVGGGVFMTLLALSCMARQHMLSRTCIFSFLLWLWLRHYGARRCCCCVRADSAFALVSLLQRRSNLPSRLGRATSLGSQGVLVGLGPSSSLPRPCWIVLSQPVPLSHHDTHSLGSGPHLFTIDSSMRHCMDSRVMFSCCAVFIL